MGAGAAAGNVVPSACRRTQANKPERSGNDDNNAPYQTHERRLLLGARRTEGRGGRHEALKVLSANAFVKRVLAYILGACF